MKSSLRREDEKEYVQLLPWRRLMLRVELR
jgi:hypothetical protein